MPRRERCERRGTRHVRRFDPALTAADHAARDARRLLLAPVLEQARERVAEAAVLDVRNAERRAARSEHAAGRTHAVGARRRGAPVDREERGARHSGAWVLRSQRSAAVVVAHARVDPARAFGRLLLFPERRARLEIVHDEAAGIEGVAAMGARHRDQHDLVGRPHVADAMDHQRIDDIEALARLVDDRLQRLFRHAGIVLEGHRGDGVVLVHVAHGADERRNRTHARIARAQRRDLLAGVEVVAGDPDRHRGQPPVTGGRRAISSPSRRRVSLVAMS